MISSDITPSPQLRQYVAQYRIRHFIFALGITPAYKPFPPRPEQCLAFYIRGSETTEYLNDGRIVQKPRSVVSGQFTYRINRFVSSPEFLMILVDLKPGALHCLTGLPFTELTNIDVDAEAFFGPEIKYANKRLSSAGSYSEMITIIESFLDTLLKKQKKEFVAIDHVLDFVTKEYGKSLDWLSRQSCLSPRQLERKFQERVGIGPKTFLRIARFNHAYWMHLKNAHLDWFSIAIACGYCDYQHLVKDYKEFANSTPNVFFEEEHKAPGRFLGLTT